MLECSRRRWLAYDNSLPAVKTHTHALLHTHIDPGSGKNHFLFAPSDPPCWLLNKHCPTREAQLNDMQEETQ